MIYFACNLRKQPSADSKIKPRSCNVERHIDDSKEAKTEHFKENIFPSPNAKSNRCWKTYFFSRRWVYVCLAKGTPGRSSCLMADSERPYYFDEFDVLLTGTAE